MTVYLEADRLQVGDGLRLRPVLPAQRVAKIDRFNEDASLIRVTYDNGDFDYLCNDQVVWIDREDGR